MNDQRKAWDPENHGYGKHDYQHIDPDTINPNDFAREFNGEEKHFGDVRQYNAGYNEKHPDNKLDLDWLSRIGTVFEVDEGPAAGTYHVTNMPVVRSPDTFIRCVKVADKDAEPNGDEIEVSCVAIGVVVNEENLHEQIPGRVLKKGRVDRDQRLRLYGKK